MKRNSGEGQNMHARASEKKEIVDYLSLIY